MKRKIIPFRLSDFLISLFIGFLSSFCLTLLTHSDDVADYNEWRSHEALVVSRKIERLAGGRGVPNVLTLQVRLVGTGCSNRCDLEFLQSLSPKEIRLAKELTPGRLIIIWVNSHNGLRAFHPSPPRFLATFLLALAIVGSLVSLLVFFALTLIRLDRKRKVRSGCFLFPFCMLPRCFRKLPCQADS